MSRIPGWTNVSGLLLRFALFAGVALCAQLAGPAWGAGVIYVRGGATGGNNGQSWADAYTDLQAGLAAAASGDEIWVAQGTYRPTSGTLRTVSFELEAGVGLYGGFAGAETERTQRNWEANATVLSGDIGTTGSATDNSYHVAIGAQLAVLDGFTITGGNANLSQAPFCLGGGMYNRNCSLTVTNCTFSGNTASIGGGMYNCDGATTVTDCVFNGNTARSSGGGIYDYRCSSDITSCTFSGNTVSNGDGGGMSSPDDSPTVTKCTFSGNTASGFGGGMYNSYGSPTVTDCTFIGNTANSDGGGMHNGNCSPSVTNCTFSGNTAGGQGGGMNNTYNSSPDVTNCTFTGNMGCYEGGGMCNYANSSPDVTNCTFSGNWAPDGSGMHNYSHSSPTVTNCAFSGNTAARFGAMYNEDCSPTVTNCTFSGNTSGFSGGAMCNNYSSSPTVTGCVFSGNTASGSGGGMFNHSASPAVANCTFSSNTAGFYGGGMDNNSDSPTVTNCTFSGNTTSGSGGGVFGGGTFANCTFTSNTASSGGGMHNTCTSPHVANSIFWDNTAPLGPEVYKDSATTLTFSHCDIKDSGGSGASWDAALGVDGGNNIDVDPLFADAATPAGPDGLWRTLDDGLRLQSNSPCIGAADPVAAPRRDILDLPRKIAPDIGAYEFLPSGYCTLTYTAGAGGLISGITPLAVASGADGPEVTAVPDTGYRFVRWSDGSTANPRTDTNVTADITVTAVFAPSEPATVKDWALYE